MVKGLSFLIYVMNQPGRFGELLFFYIWHVCLMIWVFIPGVHAA